MRLFEMKDLPKKADKAVLEWDEAIKDPKRDGKKIWLPRHESVEFFPLQPLQNNRQFLLLGPSYGAKNNCQDFFFGGTDENPFLVRLNDDVLKYFKAGGEDSFYSLLKPERVRNLEKAFSAQAIRQGDWFMIPFPLDWKSFISTLIFLQGDKFKNLKKGKEVSIGGTRHTLSGELIWANTGWSHGHDVYAYIGQGIVSAPDHTSKKLDHPHVFVQVDVLHNPKKAD